MIIREIDGSPSFLDSYVWWRNQAARNGSAVSKVFGRWGYKFDDPYYLLMTKMGASACPICDGWGEMVVNGSQHIRCMCDVDRIRGEWARKITAYESFVEPWRQDLFVYQEDGTTAALEELHGYVFGPWVENPRKWLAIVGPNGNGKTLTLRAIKTLFKPIALFITAADFEKKLFGSMDSGTLDEFMSLMGTVPILLFDDWGQEHGSKFSISKNFGFIDERYRLPHERLTVVSSNMTMSEFLVYSRSAGSRVLDQNITERFVINDTTDRRL